MQHHLCVNNAIDGVAGDEVSVDGGVFVDGGYGTVWNCLFYD
jgi:hypothetical protein